MMFLMMTTMTRCLHLRNVAKLQANRKLLPSARHRQMWNLPKVARGSTLRHLCQRFTASTQMTNRVLRDQGWVPKRPQVDARGGKRSERRIKLRVPWLKSGHTFAVIRLYN